MTKKKKENRAGLIPFNLRLDPETHSRLTQFVVENRRQFNSLNTALNVAAEKLMEAKAPQSETHSTKPPDVTNDDLTGQVKSLTTQILLLTKDQGALNLLIQQLTDKVLEGEKKIDSLAKTIGESLSRPQGVSPIPSSPKTAAK